MKKITSIILTSGLLALLVSCDMDKYPYDSIPTETAIQSVSDCEKLRTGLYRDLRIIAQNTNSLGSDFQADEFIPTSYWGNQYGSQYRWDAISSDDLFATTWSNSYNVIGQCNFMLNGIERLVNGGELSETDLATVNNIRGEAHLVRAFSYATLADRFCEAYDANTAANVYGVPLVTVYAPSADNSTYPGRSSLAETYALIKEDIANAKTYLTAPGAQMSEYLTADAVKAFEARIALLTGDYDTAISSAESLINSGAYPLINDAAAFNNMWLNDQTSEAICQLYSDKQQLAPAMGSWFLDEINNKPSFLPSADIINSYGENDIRLHVYFVEGIIEPAEGEQYTMILFNKYPGNPAMNDGSNNYVNKPKLFRIAEQYLIAAEAYAMRNNAGDMQKAYDVLFQLMSARDNTLANNPVTGTALISLIRAERERELVGEGFRLTDLKRYGEGFTRQQSQDDALSNPIGLNMQVSADNTHWLWAIPQREIDANPQIKGQQNPGY